MANGRMVIVREWEVNYGRTDPITKGNGKIIGQFYYFIILRLKAKVG